VKFLFLSFASDILYMISGVLIYELDYLFSNVIVLVEMRNGH
jgi:hypothetical protein